MLICLKSRGRKIAYFQSIPHQQRRWMNPDLYIMCLINNCIRNGVGNVLMNTAELGFNQIFHFTRKKNLISRINRHRCIKYRVKGSTANSQSLQIELVRVKQAAQTQLVVLDCFQESFAFLKKNKNK